LTSARGPAFEVVRRAGTWPAGGYPWFFHPEVVGANTFPWAVTLRAVGSTQTHFSPELLAVANPLTYIDRRYREALAEVPHLPGEARADAHRRELFYHNITRLMPILLHRKDRVSMACGFEVGVPFCDHRSSTTYGTCPGTRRPPAISRRACCGARWTTSCRTTCSTGRRARTRLRRILPTAKASASASWRSSGTRTRRCARTSTSQA
jgi:hypothetical protein